MPGFDDNTPATGAQQSALDDLFGDGLDNSGNNSINALDGNDGLSGSSGDDSLDGGAGDDLIFGGHGNDKLYGGDGNDFLLDGTERVEFREWDDEHPFDEFGGKTTKQYHEDEIARLGSAIIMRGKSWYVYDNGDGTTIAVGLTDMGSSQYEPLDPNLYPSGDDIIDGGAGNDTVYAGEGDDIIIGGTGQDKLYGGHDNDIINGGDGDDTIFGDAHESGVPGVHFTYLVSDAAVRNGSDVIDAGAGNDCVTGGGGNDVIYGGSGNDTLLGRGESRAVDSDDADADYIDGGDGDDVITGDDGDDTLLGGDGADEIRGDQETAQTRSGNDYIDGGNGDDILHGDGGNDTVLGGAGADHIQGDSLDLAGDRHGNDMLSGGDGNDIVAGLGGNDVLMGDDGDDQLMGDAAESDLALAYHGNDQLFGGAGNDLLWGGGGSDTLDGGTGNDQLDGGQGDDALSGGEGDDQLLGGVGNDTLSGGAGDDTLVAGDGNDSLSGGAGVDVLDAGAGNDTLDGGSGNDTLDGDEGDDTLYGGEGADALYGGFGSDVLSGGAGNDTLAGAQGNDRYLFNLDWGMDTIQGMAAADAGHDVIEFGAGISAEDLDVAIDVAGNLTLTLVGGTDQLTLMGFLGNAGHRIEFFDGTVWTQESMFANLAASSGGLIGDSGNNLIVAEQTIDPNVIYGGLGDDLVIGGSGSDTIFGGQGDAEIGSPVSPDDDRIFGGAGSDTIYAESGNDLVDAGSGNDAVYGGDGSDRLYGGEGDDVLNAGGSRTVSGIVFHETADDLVVGGEGNDVLGAGLGTNTYHFDAGFGQDTIYLTQASAYEVSQMGLGSESAILRFGAGISAAGIVLMRNGNEVVVQHGADQITISGYGGSTGTSIDFVFEDGTTLSAQQLEVLTRIVGSPVGETLSGTNSDDVLDGSGGDDTLVGNAGNDILIGGAGRDILNGGAGDDTYRYGLNDGIDTLYWGNVSGHDLLELGAGILPGEVTFHKETHANGNATLYMLIDATGNYIKLNITAGQSDQTVDLIRFADGTTMTIAEADAASVPMSLQLSFLADPGATSLIANEYSNEISGNSNYSTTLAGGLGDDIYYFDSYNRRGIAVENIDEGNDTVVIDSYDYTLPDNIENLVTRYVSYWYASTPRQLTGNALDNVIDSSAASTGFGWGGVNRLDGGLGADLMIGSHATDIYVIDNAGDRIFEPETSNSIDTVETSGSYSIEHSLSLENITLTGTQNTFATGNELANRLDGSSSSGANELSGGDGDDTYVIDYLDTVVEAVNGGTDTIIIRQVQPGTNTFAIPVGTNVEVFQLDTSLAHGFTLQGNGENNVLVGSTSANTLRGGAGDDEIRAGGNTSSSYGDNLYGEEGNDFLVAGSGLNFLVGGTGNDRIQVHSGTDQVRYDRGDGIDTISAINISNTWGVDTLSFGANIDSSSMIWSRNGNDLVITFTDTTTDSVTVQDYWRQVDGVDELSGVIDQFSFWNESGYRTGLTPEELGNRAPGNNYWSLTALAPTGQPFTYALPENSFSDEDMESLVYSVSELPSWLTFDPQTLTFQGTPPSGEPESYIEITATDTFGASASISLTVSVMNVIEGSNGNDTLVGTGGPDMLIGLDGNDMLDGGQGADQMIGGTGDDAYTVDNYSDRVVEEMDEGNDLVNASIDYHLPENVERLTLTGSAQNGNGNGLDNILTGNNLANYLWGADGNDTLAGGGGNDELDGGMGDDTLDGGSGNDYMYGGDGNDTYIVGSTGDVVEEWEEGGIDTVRSSVSYTLGYEVENLVLTGSSGLTGNGNELDNVITGNGGANTLRGYDGNDYLDGGSGNDIMIGGDGDDTFVVNASGDVVTELANEGTDTVISSRTYTLGTHLENLTLSGTSAINGTGNGSANILIGNNGNNSLSGLTGDDVLEGNGGTDTLTGGAGNDTYIMARTYGSDTVVDSDSTTGNLDIARFLTGITYDQLWFRRPSGSNNLEISIIGTTDKLIIKDWYQGSQNRVEEIRVDDGGMVLYMADMQALVDAMAGMTMPPQGQTTLTPSQQVALATSFASTWQSLPVAEGQNLTMRPLGIQKPALLARSGNEFAQDWDWMDFCRIADGYIMPSGEETTSIPMLVPGDDDGLVPRFRRPHLSELDQLISAMAGFRAGQPGPVILPQQDLYQNVHLSVPLA